MKKRQKGEIGDADIGRLIEEHLAGQEEELRRMKREARIKHREQRKVNRCTCICISPYKTLAQVHVHVHMYMINTFFFHQRELEANPELAHDLVEREREQKRQRQQITKEQKAKMDKKLKEKLNKRKQVGG